MPTSFSTPTTMEVICPNLLIRPIEAAPEKAPVTMASTADYHRHSFKSKHIMKEQSQFGQV